MLCLMYMVHVLHVCICTWRMHDGLTCGRQGRESKQYTSACMTNELAVVFLFNWAYLSSLTAY